MSGRGGKNVDSTENVKRGQKTIKILIIIIYMDLQGLVYNKNIE